MSIANELTGENVWLKIGGTLYKCRGTVNINLPARTADVRGSGDATPRMKAIGLDDAASITGEVLSSNRNLLTLNGTEQTTCDVMDDTTSVVGLFTGFVRLTEADDIAGAVVYNVELVPLTMPTVITHLDY